MKKTFIVLVGLLASLMSLQAHALTLSYSVEQMNADLEKARRDGGGTPRFAKDIEKYMNDLSLSVDGMKFAAGTSYKEGGCSHNWGYTADGVVTISPQTNIQFLINSLKRPIVATLDMSANVDANAKVHGALGFRFFGKCVRYVSGQVNGNVNANLNLWVSVIVELNPVYDPVARRITLTPTATLKGEAQPIVVNRLNLDVDLAVVGIPLGSLFALPETIAETLVRNMVTSADANAYFQQWLAGENVKIQQAIVAKGYSSMVLTVPPKLADEATKLGLMNLASATLSYPVTWQYLEQNNDALMFAALTNDSPSAREIFTSAAACSASSFLRSTSMIRAPIYQLSGSTCQVASINDGSSGQYYSDSACTKKNIDLQNYATICNEHMQPTIMGNPASWGGNSVGAETGWTYSYSSQFNIGYDSLAGKTLPFYKRVAFKKINPANDRTSVGIYDGEAFKAALNDCSVKYRFMDPYSSNPVPYCVQTITRDKFYRTVSNNTESTVFNTYKFDIDVSACVTQLTSAYLANPSAYNYKYGISYNYGAQIPASGQKTLLADCRTQTGNTADAQTKYALVIDGDRTTATTDISLYNSYVNQCAQYFPGPASLHYVTVNGRSLACYPVLTSSNTAFNIELEKPILRGNGNCMLEMRIFKKDPNATNLKPLIMFHGGSWNRRSFGFSGIESVIAYYTDKNYVVFAPFYRLAGSIDGNVECNNSSAKEMNADAMDAFNWVKSNGSQHGAALYAKPSVFGQSAGAYFAGYILGKTTSNDVAKGLLMYPPTDPLTYAAGYKVRYDAAKLAGKTVTRNQGDDALEAFMDAKLDWFVSTDLTIKKKFTDAAIGMSLPDLLKSGTGSHAPLYMVHGNEDELVPVSQSIALCNAMAGFSSASSIAGTYGCGSNGSTLLVVDKAAHMLDLCIDNVICPAADKAKASQALGTAKTWFTQ